MRKINLIFAAVFAVAMIVGGINVLTAAGAVDKNGVDVVNTAGANRVNPPVGKNGIDISDTVMTNNVRPSVDKNRADVVDKNNINMVRKGRRIQVDGFLLEWRGADAHVWPGSNWRWDAVSTADGVAGYVSLPAGSINTINNTGINSINISSDSSINTVGNNINNDSVGASTRPYWVLTLRAVNTGRTLEIDLPGRPSGKFFAFDKGLFDAGGPLTAEWVVPWDFFDDGGDSDAYKLSISASDAGGGDLRPLVLTVEIPGEPQAPGGLLTRLAMIAVIAALTIALVVIRRRQMREKR
jgi:hypothetical protein